MGYSRTAKRICIIHNHTDNRAVHLRNARPIRGKDNIYHIGSPIFASMYYFGMNYQIKRAYQKNPLFQNMEVTLIFDREAFIARNIRGEFHYTYDDIVKVIMTKQDFYILIGENTGFAIEKENCSPEAIEFLLELHIEHM